MEAAVFVTVCLCLWSSVLCDGTRNVTVTAGESVTLECWSPVSENDSIKVVEWNKPDLESEKYVFFFRDDHFNGKYQHPLFRGRVELRDPEMKNGNVSVLLKNVTVNDTGTYKCRVSVSRRGERLVKRHKPELINIIELTVREPGHTHGHTGGGDEDGGDKDAGNEGRGHKRVHPGWIALGCVIVVIVVVSVLIFLVFRWKKNSHQPVAADEGL